MEWHDLGKVLRIMSHLGEETKMISQVTRPQNHSKKEKQSKKQLNQKKKKRAKIQAVTSKDGNKLVEDSNNFIVRVIRRAVGKSTNCYLP